MSCEVWRAFYWMVIRISLSLNWKRTRSGSQGIHFIMNEKRESEREGEDRRIVNSALA